MNVGQDIYTFLKRNSIIVYFFGIICLIVSCASLWFAYSIYKESKNQIYTYNGKGDIIPLKLLATKENRIDQVKADFDLFTNYFYNLDQFNYERNLEKALWLGGDNIKKLYQQKQQDGLYNEFIQYNLIQSSMVKDIEVLTLDEPYLFKAIIYSEFNRNGNKKAYDIIVEGTMINVNINYPHNPFGLMIDNYVELEYKETKPINQ